MANNTTKKKYRVKLLENHRKVRDEERRKTANKRGSKTKYFMAFVARRSKKSGKLFQVFIDPRMDNDGVCTSSEAYVLTKEAVADLEEFRRSTALNILTAPQNKVDFRWIPRDMLREIRRMARRGDATVLTT